MTSYDPATGYYATEDIDPADYAPVAYAECQVCGEQANDIDALMGMDPDAFDALALPRFDGQLDYAA